MEQFGINGGFLLAQLVNFIVVLLLLTAIMWRPLVNALEARRARIAKGLEDARAAELARANAERDAQKLIDERRAEAQRLVEEGRVRAEDQGRVVIEEARREAEAIRVKARQDAEEERNALLAGVRAQVGQIAVAAAEQVIGASLVDKQKANQVIGDFFTRIPEGATKLGGSVEVTSALTLTAAEQTEVKQRLGVKDVSFKVDPGILGGLIIRAGDRVIDGSVKSGVNGLAAQMR